VCYFFLHKNLLKVLPLTGRTWRGIPLISPLLTLVCFALGFCGLPEASATTDQGSHFAQGQNRRGKLLAPEVGLVYHQPEVKWMSLLTICHQTLFCWTGGGSGGKGGVSPGDVDLVVFLI
jgi:hypothetical protein